MRTINNRTTMRFRGKVLRRGRVIDDIWLYDKETLIPKEYMKGVQKIQWDDGVVEYRICYYQRYKGTTKWSWGQFCPLFTKELMSELFELMQAKGFISTKKTRSKKEELDSGWSLSHRRETIT